MATTTPALDKQTCPGEAAAGSQSTPATEVSAAQGDEPEKCFIVRCRGQTKVGFRCSRIMSAPESALDEAYCSLHAHQRPGAPPLRHCDGTTSEGYECTIPLPKGPTDAPVLCHLHRHQRHLVEFVTCYGKTDDGSRCPTRFRWKPPYFNFCVDHASQADTFGCPITALPNDVSNIILHLLSPVDRVALALSNRSCAALVRSWAGENPPPEHLQTQSLAVRFQSPLEYFQLPPLPNLSPPTTSFAGRSRTVTIEPCNTCWKPPQNEEVGGYLYRRDPRQIPLVWIHSRHDRNFSWSNTQLVSMIRQYPFLFRDGPGNCMRCSNQLSAEDSRVWTSRFGYYVTGSGFRSTRKYAPAHRAREHNNEALLCRQCLGYSLVLDWCNRCHGDITPLAIVRAYWKTQLQEPVPPPCKKQKIEAAGE